MIKNIKDTNPFDLKVLENEPKDYLDTEDFSKFLKKKNISVREDNLPRFADTHGIKMAKKPERAQEVQFLLFIKYPLRQNWMK